MTWNLLVQQAEVVATAAHKAVGHKRKYTGECYSEHLKEVAHLVAENGGTNEMIAAAWLHDVVEDTNISLADIFCWFGAEVAELVNWLTDVSRPEDGNRKARKAIDRAHLARAPQDAQTIKLCDVISNAKSITERDPAFSRIYLREMAELLEVMDQGDVGAHHKALKLVGVPV